MILDDHCNYNASGVVLHVGGNYNQNQNHGLFYMNGNNAASNKNSNIGSRVHCDSPISLRVGNYSRYGIAHLLVEIMPMRSELVHPDRDVGKLTRQQWRDEMKRVGNLYSKMISDDNIRRAIKEVCKSHRWCAHHKPNKTTLWMETTIDERVKEIREIIENGFVPTEPKIKKRYDRNAKKWRDIAEPRLYPDQVIHHTLIQTLQPVMMRGMDNFCCGSIKGRGTYYGIKAIKKWMKNDRNGTRWCAELDIYHFYEQLKPEIVMSRMKQLVKDYRVLNLCECVMTFGVTIGAYFSQWFANTTLQPLDVIIRKCGVNHYIRYMDNFTIFASNKRVLKKVIKEIRIWLETHGLKLKDNWQYFKTRKRFPDALGYRFGHTFSMIRKHRLLSIKRQIRSYYRQICSRHYISVKFAQGLLSRLGALRHCNAKSIYARFVPNGLQRKLKDVVRKWQRRDYISWNMFLEQYGKTELKSRMSKPLETAIQT